MTRARSLGAVYKRRPPKSRIFKPPPPLVRVCPNFQNHPLPTCRTSFVDGPLTLYCINVNKSQIIFLALPLPPPVRECPKFQNHPLPTCRTSFVDGPLTLYCINVNKSQIIFLALTLDAIFISCINAKQIYQIFYSYF